jgi:alanine racemase
MRPSYRRTYAEINLDALEHNVHTLYNYHKKSLIAVVKANAYGHGDIMVARHLEKIGTQMCAVATLDEAINLRENGITMDILCMGYVEAMDVPLAIEHNIVLTLTSLDWVKRLNAFPVKHARVHLKIDTGMNRLGIKDKTQIFEALEIADSLGLVVEGIYTHFASSDDPTSPQTAKQYELFDSLLSSLNRNFKWIHSANSGAVVNFPTPNCNAVRIGLSIYGYSDYAVDLKPVMRLYASLLDIKSVTKGESVGYGANYVAQKDELIGTIGIGYADGIHRDIQGSHCSIGTVDCEYVGRICMDLCMIRLDKEYPIGTLVEIIGDHTSAKYLAKKMGTIVYELLPQLNGRIPRVYIQDNKEIAYINPRYPSPTPTYIK